MQSNNKIFPSIVLAIQNPAVLLKWFTENSEKLQFCLILLISAYFLPTFSNPLGISP